MTLFVFFAVIFAAFLHATWNAMVKGGQDKTITMGAVSFGQTLPSLILVFVLPFPSIEALPYLLPSIFVHAGYQIFLLKSYEVGDLTQVYPIARGSAPLIVTLASFSVLGLELSRLEVIAIIFIASGIISLSLVNYKKLASKRFAVLLSLTTGALIASYSLLDGFGARAAQNSLSYLSWVMIGDSIVFGLYLKFAAPHSFKGIYQNAKNIFLIGGIASFSAYAIVIWAFTQAPIASITALRETSVLFALIIGTIFLREHLDWRKLLSIFITLAGVILLRFSQ